MTKRAGTALLECGPDVKLTRPRLPDTVRVSWRPAVFGTIQVICPLAWFARRTLRTRACQRTVRMLRFRYNLGWHRSFSAVCG